MARLQDMSTVKPATTDNLLIVQAAGQGLAKIEDVGAVINGSTDISVVGDGTVTGAISSLNNSLKNSYPGFTYSENPDLTSDYGDFTYKYMYKVGRIVHYAICFSVTTDIPSGTTFISGFDGMRRQFAAFTSCIANDGYILFLVSGGELRCKTAIPSGASLRFNFSYMSNTSA